MGLFSRIFRRDLEQCPRCLGKGHVDWDDIRRLNQEHKWRPGKCAYCGGSGKVSAKTKNLVPVDTTYLANNLPPEERKKLLSGDPEAMGRATAFSANLEHLISQIKYLHFEKNLDAPEIAALLTIGHEDKSAYEKEKQQMIEYVESVIKKRN